MLQYGEIEWLTPGWLFWLFRFRVGLIRVWAKETAPGLKNKEPYLFACTIKHVDKDTVELLGVDSKVTIYIFKQLTKTISNNGYKKAFWIRYKDGKKTKVEFNPTEKFINKI